MDPAHLVDRHTPVEEKIRLFRSLFRGREDIYARRFESRKTGRSGYAPACANEWVRGICEKPRIKCAECPHRRFLPMTDEVIRWHLSGADAEGKPFVAGIYPLLTDDSCWSVAIDFDKSGWREDASACLEACRLLDLPAVLERSRSGNGAHLWLFFEEPVPASLARRLASHILTETMERRPQVHSRNIPADLESRLFRRLQMIDDATTDQDLRVPPSNHFEKLRGNLAGFHSIRVNKQWRLIFQWNSSRGEAESVYLDDHSYR